MNEPKPVKSSFLASTRAVFWGMLGVRKQSGHDEDIAQVTAKQAIIAGLIGVVLFILILVFVVSLVLPE
ncbi:MAG: DUF2970 domain-containing protein [Granulosicoccaceae bacterium]|jgi:hypothetical protein